MKKRNRKDLVVNTTRTCIGICECYCPVCQAVAAASLPATTENLWRTCADEALRSVIFSSKLDCSSLLSSGLSHTIPQRPA